MRTDRYVVSSMWSSQKVQMHQMHQRQLIRERCAGDFPHTTLYPWKPDCCCGCTADCAGGVVAHCGRLGAGRLGECCAATNRPTTCAPAGPSTRDPAGRRDG